MNFNWNCSKAEEINFVYRDSHFFIKIFLISIYIENNSFIESFQSLEESGTLNKNEKKKLVFVTSQNTKMSYLIHVYI